MKISHLIFVAAGVSFSVLFFPSCNSTKKLQPGEYLLERNAIINKYGTIDKNKIEAYIKQKPNREVLGWKMYLHIYNSVDEKKLAHIREKRKAKRKAYNERKKEKYESMNKKRESEGKKKRAYSLRKEDPFMFRTWWLNIGEPPVVYDSMLAKKSARQIKLFLNNKGFFNSTVSDSVHKKGRRAYVFYRIKEGVPYKVRNILYEIKDPQLEYHVLSEASASLIARGVNYDTDILQQERDRISNHLRNIGYFNFNKEFIYFEVDSNLGSHEVDIVIGIKNPIYKVEGVKSLSGGDSLRESLHVRYYINNIYVHTDYDVQLKDVREDTLAAADSSIFLLYRNYLRYKEQLFTDAIFLSRGGLYQQRHLDQTYRRLSELKLFRSVQLMFTQVSSDKIDCNIYLSSVPRQSFSAETEGINTSGTLGIAGNLVYQNKNVFKGGELFEVKFKGALEVQKTRLKEQNEILSNIESPIPFNTLEMGSEANVRVPRFLTPFKGIGRKSNNAKTNFTGTLNYQRRPDYSRYLANASFGYSWKETAAKSHLINPIEYSLINIFILSDELDSVINNSKDLFLKNSYSPHFTLSTRYAFVFNNQDIFRQKNYSYLRCAAEGAGNLLRQVFKFIDKNIEPLDYVLDSMKNNDGSYDKEINYTIEHIRFSQYIRFDVDYRYYKMNVIDPSDKLVYRFAVGVGKPFQNLRVLPLEKSFFVGGPNSVRAWQTRTLGPGAYYDSTGKNHADKIGDIKIEANIEYRFNVFKILNAALFVDAGNVWLRKKYDSYPKGEFNWVGCKTTESFINQIAIGAGMGFRLDFSFFIIRLDAAFKLKDPALHPGHRWMIGKNSLKDTVLNFGIGYPF